MTSMDAESAPKARRVSPVFVIWVTAIAAIIILDYVDRILDRFGRYFFPVNLASFVAWLIVIALTIYGFAIASRWLLRKLFWTVGRRLFLSYVMLGVLPFFLFAVLLTAILYVIAGVASQTRFKNERQATLGELESLNTEYALQGRMPRTEGMEVYDSTKPSGKQIPAWLQSRTYSGFTLRNDAPLLVAAREYPGERTVVLALPLDERWSRRMEEQSGMVVATKLAAKEREGFSINPENSDFKDFKDRGVKWGNIFFYEITEEGGLADWETGAADPEKRLFTAIAHPFERLTEYYFGGATNSAIMKAIFYVIGGLTLALMLAYAVAALFAAMLIFSISRAVNRIEKGTRAVERGDFTYRIKMKRDNQLGAMAQSFDRMTESIGSLLTSVTEKERLQSEIEIAATIQRNLLPKEGPQFAGVAFSAHFEPNASIGGDYYDVFNIDERRLAVAIGDVSGHGLSTGLVMAMVKAAMTTLVEEGADETSLFRRLNDLVYRSTERRAFMTLAFTIFDLERRTIRHTNAGHLYPYLLRQGVAEPLSIESPSLPLGVRTHITSNTVEVDLREGDVLVYLSDGMVEAQNENGDPFGFDQMEKLLASQPDHDAAALRAVILDAVAKHSGTRPADDDRTVMIVQFSSLECGSAVPAFESGGTAALQTIG